MNDPPRFYPVEAYEEIESREAGAQDQDVVIPGDAPQRFLRPWIAEIAGTAMEGSVVHARITGRKIAEGQNNTAGGKSSSIFRGDMEEIAPWLNVRYLAAQELQVPRPAACFLEELADVSAVDSAGQKIVRGNGDDPDISQCVPPGGQPLREIVRSVRKGAHFTGGNIEQVSKAVRAVGYAPPKGAIFVRDEDAEAGSNAGQMDGDQRAGEAGAGDGDIEKLNFLTHGWSRGRTGEVVRCPRLA